MSELDVLLAHVGRWRFAGGFASSFPTSAGPILTVHHRRFRLVARQHGTNAERVHFEGSWACAERVLSGLAAGVAASAVPGTHEPHSPRSTSGTANDSSVSHGNRTHVVCGISRMQRSVDGRPSGLA